MPTLTVTVRRGHNRQTLIRQFDRNWQLETAGFIRKADRRSRIVPGRFASTAAGPLTITVLGS